ncbi:MAG: L-erythro-3,5-diaminohexanoate dehydrogenase [Acidimicrobiales bacterium]
MTSDLYFVNPAALGSQRSLSPKGSLPHMADRLDATAPANEFEAEVEVEMLNLDATSYRQIRLACDNDADAMAARIRAIVAERGKLHNPVTGSGGVLLGHLSVLGASFWQAGLLLGQRVVPLASLVATPLRLDDVGPVDLTSPQVPARGRAIVTGRMSCAAVPDDLPLSVVLTALDVYPAASHVRSLARPGDHVIIIGSGHAGLAAAAAAREAVGSTGGVTVIDPSTDALGWAAAVDPAATTVVADATDAFGVAGMLGARGLWRGDLTLVCTNVTGCEGTAILLTKDDGTVLFFSTATSFSAAGLGADSLSSLATLSIPNGYTPDRGSYLLDLLRRSPALLSALGGGRNGADGPGVGK